MKINNSLPQFQIRVINLNKYNCSITNAFYFKRNTLKIGQIPRRSISNFSIQCTYNCEIFNFEYERFKLKHS